MSINNKDKKQDDDNVSELYEKHLLFKEDRWLK